MGALAGLYLNILAFISYILTLYIWIIIAAAVFSWLVVFNVINMHNPFAASVANLLYHLTEPVLRPIRRRLPDLGGIDLSPLVLILIIIFIQQVILPFLARLVL